MSTNYVVLCLGKRGHGKSFSVKRSIDKLGRHSPVYIWDYNREYAGPQAKDGIRDALFFRSWPQFLAAASAQEGHLGKVALQVDRSRFAAFCKFIHRCGGCTVVLDELHDFVRPDQVENRAAFIELLTTSRHRRINIFAAAWRPTALPPEARNAADEIRAFHTKEPTDLDWYRRASCSEEFVINLTRLPKRKCAVWRGDQVVSEPTKGTHVQADPPDRGRRDRDRSDRGARGRARPHRAPVNDGGGEA